MDILGIVYATICVLAWGSWLVPSQQVVFPNEQAKTFFVALATILTAAVVIAFRDELGQLSSTMAWVPVIGGLIWAAGAYCAFVGCKHIGVAKAFGIWAPLNMIFSFIWSLTLFGDFRDSSIQAWLIGLVALIVMVGGIFMIIFSGNSSDDTDRSTKSTLKGLLGAVGAGILWGTFYIPATYVSQTSKELAEISPWASVVPLSFGMLIGTLILVAMTRTAPKLQSKICYAKALFSGVLWAIGFFAMLLMVDSIGAGPGNTIAQLCVAVNALWGVFYFKDPAPKTKAANMTLLGVLIACLAGMVLGNFGRMDQMLGNKPQQTIEDVKAANE